MPHLSLLYGIFSVEVKEQIIANLTENLKMMFIVKSLNVMRIKGMDPKSPSKTLRIRLPLKENHFLKFPIQRKKKY